MTEPKTKWIVELEPGVYSTRGPMTGTRVMKYATRYGASELAESARVIASNVYGYKSAKIVEVTENSDLGIMNSAQQYHAGRVGIGFGLVVNTLSAVRGCLRCNGTGVPIAVNDSK
jgi:hypothetical protein